MKSTYFIKNLIIIKTNFLEPLSIYIQFKEHKKKLWTDDFIEINYRSLYQSVDVNKTGKISFKDWMNYWNEVL